MSVWLPFVSHVVDHRSGEEFINGVALVDSRLASTAKLFEKNRIAVRQLLNNHGARFGRNGVKSVAHYCLQP